MTKQDIIDYALTKKKAYLDYPFDDQTACVRIKAGEKTPIFVQILADDRITVRVDVYEGEFYRQQYPNSVRRGYHCPQVQQPYWNTVLLNGEVDETELKYLIDRAYSLTVEKLPKYLKDQIDKE